MVEFIKKLVASSKNANEISLSIKGILGTILGAASSLAVYAGKPIDPSIVEQIVTYSGLAVTAFFSVVSALAGIWGLIRRIINTLKGK